MTGQERCSLVDPALSSTGQVQIRLIFYEEQGRAGWLRRPVRLHGNQELSPPRRALTNGVWVGDPALSYCLSAAGGALGAVF